MADNYQADPGTGGKVFASDELVGGPTGDADWPFCKLAYGGLGSATIVDTGTPLPVKVGLAAASIVAGQISLSGAEVALTTATARRFKLKADIDNTDIVVLGPAGVTTSTGYVLRGGDEVSDLQLSNLNVVHAIVGSGTQILRYIGEV